MSSKPMKLLEINLTFIQKDVNCYPTVGKSGELWFGNFSDFGTFILVDRACHLLKDHIVIRSITKGA